MSDELVYRLTLTDWELSVLTTLMENDSVDSEASGSHDAEVWPLLEKLRNAKSEPSVSRLLYIAENLHAMVPRDVWRKHGGDDGQGHYEGDYHAEQLRDELASYRAALAPEGAGNAGH